jgi:hypothetical protein
MRTPFQRTVLNRTRKVRLDLPNHERMDIALDSGTRDLDLQMKLRPGFTRVISDPPGADVYVGGEKLPGVITPLFDLELPSGPREIRIQRKGYEAWVGTIGPGQKPLGVIKLVPLS